MYGYDQLSRLVSAEVRDGYNNPTGTLDTAYAYEYDVAGNRTKRTVDAAVTNYSYNAANQLTGDGTDTFTYDPNGNLLGDGSNVYTWDRANRMLTAPGSTSYQYDGNGDRIQQTVSSVVTDYLLDVQPGLTKVIGATVSSNTTHYVHGPRGIHAQDVSATPPTTGNWGSFDWGDGTVWGPAGSGLGWEYMLQDGLGSVRSVVDVDRVVLDSFVFDPYGEAQGTYTETPFGFTGEWTDDNDLLYLRARNYAPETGVFTALDPFEGIHDRPMSLNGYSWVEGNPIMNTDPSGEIAIPLLLGLGALALVGLGIYAYVNPCFPEIGSPQCRAAAQALQDLCLPDLEVLIPERLRQHPLDQKEENPFRRYLDDPEITPGPYYNPFDQPNPGPQQATSTSTPPATPTSTKEPCDSAAFTRWAGIGDAESRTGAQYDFQRKHCGEVYPVSGGGASVNADGIRTSDCYLLECKYVDDPENSPYVLDIRSGLRPSKLRVYEKFIDPVQDNEFQRYATVINNSPAVGLEVIINEPRSETYWIQWITKHSVPNARIVPKAP